MGEFSVAAGAPRRLRLLNRAEISRTSVVTAEERAAWRLPALRVAVCDAWGNACSQAAQPMQLVLTNAGQQEVAGIDSAVVNGGAAFGELRLEDLGVAQLGLYRVAARWSPGDGGPPLALKVCNVHVAEQGVAGLQAALAEKEERCVGLLVVHVAYILL